MKKSPNAEAALGDKPLHIYKQWAEPAGQRRKRGFIPLL